MRFGVYAPTSGEYDVPALTALARDAEASGWDGFFVWDNLMATFDGGNVLADTTVALTAIALATERVQFGALVTALARRRPWKFAKECATLDRLSDGRLVAGVGLGGTWDFLPFGEELDERTRGDVLDESLEVVAALWSGDHIDHAGERFALRGARLLPAPSRRIPVWVAGYWPGTRPFRRAARWDGVAPVRKGHAFKGLAPDELRACVEFVRRHREGDRPFDVVHFHAAGEESPAPVEEYERAGATWWLDSTFAPEESLAAFRERVRAGPPTV